MKAFFAALFLTAGLLCPCAHAQQDEEDLKENLKEFLEIKAKAEQGNAKAQASLGGYYYTGIMGASIGVVKDQAEAVKWYRKAAEQGHSEGQRMLAIAHMNGKGVSRDYTEAYAWLNLYFLNYSARGFRTSVVSEKNFEDLRTLMTPQQITDGQQRTKELQAMIEAKAKVKAAK